MKSRIFFWPKIVEIYRQFFMVLKKDPMVGILFMILGLFDLAALLTLFLAPSPPFSYLLAPIIRRFWSETYLHYPENFLLLPKLFNHAHFLIITSLGVFITGLVIKKIEGQVKEGEIVPLFSAVRAVYKRYFSLVVVWLASYGLFTLLFEVVVSIVAKYLWVRWVVLFVTGVLLQGLAVFLLPSLLILEGGWLRRIWKGLNFGIQNVLTTSGLIAFPMMLTMVVSFFKLLTPFYVQIFPELTLWVLIASIGILTLVDLFMTSCTTILFLKMADKI